MFVSYDIIKLGTIEKTVILRKFIFWHLTTVSEKNSVEYPWWNVLYVSVVRNSE